MKAEHSSRTITQIKIIFVCLWLCSEAIAADRMSSNATSAPLVLQKYSDNDINIKIDGHLNESVWAREKGVNSMSVIEPDTLVATESDTVSQFIYTELGLYVGIWNDQPAETLLPRLTKRDAYINRDGNSVLLDTSGESLYGLWFDINLGGSIGDGMLLPEKTFTLDWDGAWQGNAATAENGYTTEYFLPWSMMAMPEASQDRKMKVMITRRVAHLDETWGWPALPYTGSKFISAMQSIQLTDVNPQQQYAIYPYTSATYDVLSADTEYRTGLDIFWRPTSNLQLTATLNPDFGTVESDNVVVNLTAFETFFSEKRMFFAEGNEIFVTTPRANPFGDSSSYEIGARKVSSNFFPTPTTLLNTRRIGAAALSPDIPKGTEISAAELFQPSELYGAFKVTGQKGAFRYGVLTAFEEDTRFHGVDGNSRRIRIEQQGRDFGVLRFSYEDTTNGLKSLGWISTAVMHSTRDAFVQGIDGHYISASGRWRADGQLIYSDIEDEIAGNNEGFGALADLSYKPRQGVSHSMKLDYLDEDLDVNDLGFIRRNDVVSMSYKYEHLTSELDLLRSWTWSLLFSQEYNGEGRAVRSGVFWRNSMIFPNSMNLRTELNYFPKRWDDRNSDGNGQFRIKDRWVGEVGIGTDSSKILSISLAGGMTQEELGAWTKVLKGGFTFKPIDRLSFDLDFIYQRRDGWLLHQENRNFTTFKSINWFPQISADYFLSARQQLRFTLQWAGIRADEQAFYEVPMDDGSLISVDKDPLESSDNFGISQITTQLRYRWEIAPLSDLFIVYTRGSNLVTIGDDTFADFFRDALSEPLVETFVMKLRYRFGT